MKRKRAADKTADALPPTDKLRDTGGRAQETPAHKHRACVRALGLSLLEAHLDAFISRGTGGEARHDAHRRGARRDEKRSAITATCSPHRKNAAFWRFWKSSQRAPSRWGRTRGSRARAPPRRATQHTRDASATAVRSSARRSRPRATSPGGSSVDRRHRDGRRGVAGPGGASRVVDGGVLS